MNLNETDKNRIIELVKAGEKLPKEFIYKLFADEDDVFLFWNGRKEDATNVTLPFHSIEHIDEPRKEEKKQDDMFEIGLTPQFIQELKEKGVSFSLKYRPKDVFDKLAHWAIDFNYEDKKEIIKIKNDSGETEEQWTGNYLFENEWQSFRTRKNPALEFTSIACEYKKAGKYKVLVKVVDIPGIDSSKIIEVMIG